MIEQFYDIFVQCIKYTEICEKMNKKHIENIQKTGRKHAKNMQKTCRKTY